MIQEPQVGDTVLYRTRIYYLQEWKEPNIAVLSWKDNRILADKKELELLEKKETI